VDMIMNRTGFFFGGGDQARLITCFFDDPITRKPTKAFVAIQNRYNSGSLISGSSAGLAIHPKDGMVTGGVSYLGLKYGPFKYTDKLPNEDCLTYDPQGGFGFFTYGLLDSHHSQRGRQGRMIRLAHHLKNNYVFGVDEDTALVVTNADTDNVKMDVIGSGGVFIFDLSKSHNETKVNWNLRDVKASYLTDGDSYIPHKKCLFASWKTPMKGHENQKYAKSSRDIFGSPDNPHRRSMEFVLIATSLIDAYEDSMTIGITYESNPAFNVLFDKTNDDTIGYIGKDKDISFCSLRIDIV